MCRRPDVPRGFTGGGSSADDPAEPRLPGRLVARFSAVAAVTMRSVKGADDLSVILAFYGEFTIFVHEAARFSIRFRTRGLRIRLRFFNFAL